MNKEPDKRILRFIEKHHVLTLATSNNNVPWCANCFYVYLKKGNIFIFSSDNDTRHIQEAIQQPRVSGSIMLETKIVGKIQGIQFSGYLFPCEDEFLKQAQKAYLTKFPYAILTDISLWGIEITYIKMTDNRLGFGKKLIWERN